MTAKTSFSERGEAIEVVCLAAALAVSAGAAIAFPDAQWALAVVSALVVGALVLRIKSPRLQRREQLHRWRHLASHDALTGLPNRVTFVERLERSWNRSRDIAVLYIDLDGFKDVNDTLGHAVGDELLVQVADRLSSGVRERDVVARFGGDEFVALLSDCARVDAAEVAERLRLMLAVPYRVQGRDVVISASIGLCPPGVCEAPDQALQQADLALYRAKDLGRDQVCLFDEGIALASLGREEAAREIESALRDGRLRLVYQPEIDLDSGRVTAVEALLRVDQVNDAEVPLMALLAAAEETGLSGALTTWVLDTALQDAQTWRDIGWHGRVSVNVPCRQLRDGDLVTLVHEALERHGARGDTLTLEFSEPGLRDLRESTARVLDRLRDMGVAATLDDFGTGQSSLTLLREFPWDYLKVDHSLVAVESGLAAPLARLASELGLEVIAEGIETPLQLAEQRAAGVRRGQGYLLAAPLRPDDVLPVLAVGRVRHPS